MKVYIFFYLDLSTVSRFFLALKQKKQIIYAQDILLSNKHCKTFDSKGAISFKIGKSFLSVGNGLMRPTLGNKT